MSTPMKTMREEFYMWVEDRGCDTDGAWSAWQGCWNLLAPGRLTGGEADVQRLVNLARDYAVFLNKSDLTNADERLHALEAALRTALRR